jgi:hypothetical protein
MRPLWLLEVNPMNPGPRMPKGPPEHRKIVATRAKGQARRLTLILLLRQLHRERNDGRHDPKNVHRIATELGRGTEPACNRFRAKCAACRCYVCNYGEKKLGRWLNSKACELYLV